jgi:hypothetical protein
VPQVRVRSLDAHLGILTVVSLAQLLMLNSVVDKFHGQRQKFGLAKGSLKTVFARFGRRLR